MTAPLYAVLFRTHFWDDFTTRRFNDLRSRVRSGDVWISLDGSNCRTDKITHDKIFCTNQGDFAELGLAEYPSDKVCWYNNDYHLLLFYNQYPGYEYYVNLEYDAATTVDLDTLVRSAADAEVDLIGFPNTKPIERWGWRKTCTEFWEENKIISSLLCISAYSKKSLSHLLALRRDHTQRLNNGYVNNWPFCEAFVPTALKEAGYKIDWLDNYGNTAAYDWWPPRHETELDQIGAGAFVHPVLTGQRYVNSLLRYRSGLDWFDPTSTLRRSLDLEPPEIVVPELYQKFASARQWSALASLKQVMRDNDWRSFDLPIDRTLRTGSSGRRINLASGRFAYQSSTSPWSQDPDPAKDAAFAVDGQFRRGHTFHTKWEINPWWLVDLGQLAAVAEIIIYNRAVEKARSRTISVWGSTNGRHWDRLYRHKSHAVFGCADDDPLKISLEEAAMARFIRLELEGGNFLHLDEVEILGVPLGDNFAESQSGRPLR